MYIVYRDTMGSYRIDGIGTISFLDGIVFFSAGFDDFELYISQIVEIGMED